MSEAPSKASSSPPDSPVLRTVSERGTRGRDLRVMAASESAAGSSEMAASLAGRAAREEWEEQAEECAVRGALNSGWNVSE